MSHLTSSPPKPKGEHKGHSLPRGSERWAGPRAGRRAVHSGVDLGTGARGSRLRDPPAHARGSSSRDKDRSSSVSSSTSMPAGGKGSRPSSTPSVPQKTPNRLINEKSPYLLQHAYNPVDW